MNERRLLDLIGEDLRREQVVESSTNEDKDLEKAVPRKRGTFVAVTDPEGRFCRVIDRATLVDRIPTGRNN